MDQGIGGLRSRILGATYSPDGTKIASDKLNNQIAIYDSTSYAELSVLTPGLTGNRPYSWGDDGRIYFTSDGVGPVGLYSVDATDENDVLEITTENLERFQAAFQNAGVTDDDVNRLQLLLIRFEKDTAEKEFNFEHLHIAFRVRQSVNRWGMNPDAAYAKVADEVGLDKSTVGKICRNFSRS